MRETFSHGHYERIRPLPSHRHSFFEPRYHNLALLEIPHIDPRNFITTIDLDPDTDIGKRVCQQLMLDLGRFWLGVPVQYFVLYQRDWLA